jgi:hypothetical protein
MSLFRVVQRVHHRCVGTTVRGTQQELPAFFDDSESETMMASIPMKWTRLPDAPMKIRHTSVASMTAKGLTLFTGRRGLALQNDQWTAMPVCRNMPAQIEAIARINDYQVFLVGKFSPWLSRVLRSKVFVYDLDKNTCTRLDKSRANVALPKEHALLPMQRGNISVAPRFLNNKLYVFGDPDPTRTAQELTVQRLACGVASFDLTQRDKPFAYIRQLPLTTKPGPSGRKQHFNTILDDATGKLIIVTQSDGLSLTEFDPQTLTFSDTVVIGSVRRVRFDFTTGIIRDAANVPHLIVYGGFTPGVVQSHIPDVDVFNMVTKQWKRAVFAPSEPSPEPRREAGACATSPNSLAIFGGRDHFRENSDAWLLTFVS